MDIEALNKRIADIYGKGIDDKSAKYRVVFADYQIETITGWWEKHTEAGLYLGREFCTRTTKKYLMYEGFWLLEYFQLNTSNEISERFVYDVLWVFRSKDNKPLPPDWEVIEKIVYFHTHKAAPPSQATLDHDYNERIEKEKIEMLDFLRHDKTMPDRMFDTPLVTVPANFERNK